MVVYSEDALMPNVVIKLILPFLFITFFFIVSFYQSSWSSQLYNRYSCTSTHTHVRNQGQNKKICVGGTLQKKSSRAANVLKEHVSFWVGWLCTLYLTHQPNLHPISYTLWPVDLTLAPLTFRSSDFHIPINKQIRFELRNTCHYHQWSSSTLTQTMY